MKKCSTERCTPTYDLMRCIKLMRSPDIIIKDSDLDTLTKLKGLDSACVFGQDILDKSLNAAVFLIDIDNFKAINDTYGYLAANRVLFQISRILTSWMDAVNGLAGRLGGDEFVLIFQYDELDKIEDIRKDLEADLKGEIFQPDKQFNKISLSFTIGTAASSREKPSSIEELLHIADMDMYRGKYEKFNKISEYGEGEELKCLGCRNCVKCGQLLKVLCEKDMYTYVHSKYVAKYAVGFAQYLGFTETSKEMINRASWFHDVGKIMISNTILRKPGKLTNEEYEIMKNHVQYGIKILECTDISSEILDMIKSHHERWDGKGYPYGICSDKLSVEARILQICDSYSAMTIRRVYRDRLSIDKASEELKAGSSKQFDPFLVEKFIKFIKEKNYAMQV